MGEVADELSVGGEDADVAVVDEDEDVLSSVGAPDAEVAEFPGVAEGDFAGLSTRSRRMRNCGVADRCAAGVALTRAS